MKTFCTLAPDFFALKRGKPFSCFQDIVKAIIMWLGHIPTINDNECYGDTYSPFTEHNEAEGVAN